MDDGRDDGPHTGLSIRHTDFNGCDERVYYIINVEIHYICVCVKKGFNAWRTHCAMQASGRDVALVWSTC